MKKSIDIKQGGPDIVEHKKIVLFLADELPKFMDENKLRRKKSKSINTLLKALCADESCSFELSQKLITENLDLDGRRDRSYVSRKVDVLNPVLKDFCKEYGINPPIQLFFYHEDPIRPFGCHFACSEPKVIKRKARSGKSACRTILCSTEIVHLEDAMKNGKSAEDKKSQEAISKIKENLISEATEQLRKKLDASDINDYKPLDLEIGTIEHEQYRIDDDLSDDKQNDQPKKHGRVWRPYNIECLVDFKGVYILSSDVGTGKTTFLRNLQLELLKKNEKIPVYIHASKIEKWQDIDYISLEKHLKEKFGNNISGEIPHDFWAEVFKKRLVLLIDGLDQITGTGDAYKCFLDDLLTLAGSEHIDMLVASRPTAVVSAEDDEEVYFLQLMPFGTDVQKAYFGEYYIRALEICRHDSRMMGIPMLAFMARFLIDKKQDENVRNRKDLYERFMDYVFIKYKHEKLTISRQKRLDIRYALQNISYEALINKNIEPQRIPLEFCRKQIFDLKLKIEVDDLSKHGIMNFVVDDTKNSEEILLFTHQSFQEYLAAEWASESEARINYLIENYWDPKWKEVLRFLVNGKNGKAIIRKIYSNELIDNKIYSRLLFAAQLASELENEILYKHEVFKTLRDIDFAGTPFETEILSAMIDLQIRESQDYAWNALKKISSSDFFHKVREVLENSNYINTLFNEDRLKWAIENLIEIEQYLAIYILGCWKDYLKDEHIDLIIRLPKGGIYRSSTVKSIVLQKLETSLTESHVEQIMNLLKSSDVSTQVDGIYYTAYIPGRIKTKELQLIISCLGSNNKHVINAVAFSIANQFYPLPRSIVHELLEFYLNFQPSDYAIGYFSDVLGNILEQDDLDIVMDNFSKNDVLQVKALYLLRCSQYKVGGKYLQELFKFINSPLHLYGLYWEVIAKHCSSESEAYYLLNRLGKERYGTRSEIALPLFRYLNKYIREQDIEIVLECLNGRNPSDACPALAYVFGQLDDEQKLKTLKSFIEPPYKIATTFNYGDEIFKLFSANFSHKHNRYVINSIVNENGVNKFMVYWPLINPSLLEDNDITCLEQFLEHPIPKVRDCSCKILKELHSLGMY